MEQVNHPSHYNQEGKKECIEEMLDTCGVLATYWFCKLNVFKYMYRAGNKEGNSAMQDLAKAHWYDEYAEKLAVIGVGMDDVAKAIAPWLSIGIELQETEENKANG